MRKSFLFLGWAMFFLPFMACAPNVRYVYEDRPENKAIQSWHRVREVMSGDTIRLEDGAIVRYLGISAPQKGEKLFESARKANEILLRAGIVVLHFDKQTKDSHGYTLAYVHAPSPVGAYCFANLELLNFGRAKLDLSFPCRYEREFRQAEQEARENKMGIWDSPDAAKIPTP